MKGDEPLLGVLNVLKTFGPVRVLRSLSVSFGPGECVLLLGANGAGKSTFLRVLAGLSRADQGRVLNSFPGQVGFLSHHLFVYGRLSVRENLTLFAKLTGRSDVDGIIARWGLEGYADIVVNDLSRGNQSRVALARAFMSDPSVLLLDEPSSHLDDRGIQLLVDGLEHTRAACAGKSLTVIATHDIHRLGSLATRVVVLGRGEIVADSGPGAAPDQIQHVMDLYRESNR